MLDQQFQETLAILNSSESSLRALADLTSLDTFDFYVGADLRGLDLSNQDLIGLNFCKADFRGCNLSNIKYDIGAFNGCILDSDKQHLSDDFDLTLEDIIFLGEKLSYLEYRVKFRPESLELFYIYNPYNYQDMSERAGISASTFRKARRGLSVSRSTARRIAQYFIVQMQSTEFQSVYNSTRILSVLRQPIANILGLTSNGATGVISRETLVAYSVDFLSYWNLRTNIIEKIVDEMKDS